MVCRFLHQSFYEWARRKTNDTTIALFVKRNNNKNGSKTSNRILGPNPSAYCDQHKAHGHSSNDCLWRKRLENKKADARVAVNTNPTDSTSSIANIASNKSDNAIIDYSSDARAFIMQMRILTLQLRTRYSS